MFVLIVGDSGLKSLVVRVVMLFELFELIMGGDFGGDIVTGRGLTCASASAFRRSERNVNIPEVAENSLQNLRDFLKLRDLTSEITHKSRSLEN